MSRAGPYASYRGAVNSNETSRTAPSAATSTGASPLSSTERTRLRRGSKRALTERSALYEVLDAGRICHLGVIVDGAPRVIPTAYGRVGDVLYLHGSTGARSLRTGTGTGTETAGGEAAESDQDTGDSVSSGSGGSGGSGADAREAGGEVCVTVTHLDGLVLGRSVFHHSVNYRSAMVYGRPRTVTDTEEKLAGLRAITERLAPGQWAAARLPNRRELAATAVLALPLAEASVKVRQGPPVDEDEDYALGVWAGVIPVEQVLGTPVPDPRLHAGIPAPSHITTMR